MAYQGAYYISVPSDYNDRVQQCQAALDGHQMHKFYLVRRKRLSYFNLSIEALVIAASTWTGVHSYKLAKKEESFLIAHISNPVYLRATTPIPWMMGFVVVTTGFFVMWDMSILSMTNRMLSLEDSTMERCKQDMVTAINEKKSDDATS